MAPRRLGASLSLALAATLVAAFAHGAPPNAENAAHQKLDSASHGGAAHRTANNKPAAPRDTKNATAATKPAAGSAAAARGARTWEAAVRRQIAGGPTVDDTALGADTPELRALSAAERELFPPASPYLGSKWPDELPFPVGGEDRPRVHASGLPAGAPPSAPPPSEAGKDTTWLSKLDMPDLPVRFEPRVVRYLEFFKDDPRGRAIFTLWLKRSGKYGATIKKVLRKKGLPEDLAALAMIESGFDPVARSHAGAVGMWQFMTDTAKIYGLTTDRWADLRMSLGPATEAAADHLADLHRRFGSWDLAMAGYNMGYGGVLSAVRRYNTNDFWALSKLEGSLPWETTLYVPKILAAAVVSKNLAAFGYQDVVSEPAIEGEEVQVAPGTALSTVAQACGAAAKDVEALNPELRAQRTPPAQEDWPVKVPVGKAAACAQSLSKARRPMDPAIERYVVRFGESLEQIAQARKVPVSKLVELNAIGPGEIVRGGTILLVPKVDVPAEKPKTTEKPVVVVPQDVFVYPDRRRVFYRVQIGDTVRDVCTELEVTPDELRRWNGVDTSARLVEGMTLQVFVPQDVDLAKVVVLRPDEVRTVVTGSEEFFAHWEDKGRKRIVVIAKAGDTLESIGKKHNVLASLMERINRRSRKDVLAEGERVVVWAPGPSTPATGNEVASLTKRDPLAPEPTPPLGAPPFPDQLPALP